MKQLTILILCLASVVSQAQQSIPAIRGEINIYFPSTGNKSIQAIRLRETLNDVLDHVDTLNKKKYAKTVATARLINNTNYELVYITDSGKEGWFRYISGSGAVDDNTNTIVAANGRRYIREVVRATTVDDGFVTNSKLANVPANTIKGNNTGSSAVVQDLTIAQAKTMLAIDQVSNTSDPNKPISIATQTALNTKHPNITIMDESTALGGAGQIVRMKFVGESITGTRDVDTVTVTVSPPVTSVSGRTGDVTLTKNDVGLSDVTNTTDANKPVSTAQQTALNTKQNLVQYRDEGSNVGTSGEITNINVTGVSLNATNSGGNLTLSSDDYAVIVVAVSDEVNTISSGTNLVTYRMPFPMQISSVRASLSTAQTTGSILTVQIKEGGANILSTPLSIDNTEKTSVTAATQPVVSDNTLADDSEIQIDTTQARNWRSRFKNISNRKTNMRAFFVLFLFLASFFTRAQTVVIIPYFYIDPDAINFINSAGITSTTQRNAIDRLVKRAKLNGWWTKCLAIYPLVGGTATSHAFNLKNTAQYNITWSGSLTHTSGGIVSNGGFGNTNLNPSTIGMTIGNVHLSATMTKTGTRPSYDYTMGGKGSTSGTTLLMAISEMSSLSIAHLNFGSVTGYTAGFTGSGVHIATRSGSTTTLYIGTTTSNTASTIGGTVCNVKLYVMGYNNNGTAVAYSPNSICNFFTIGTSLTSTEANDMATDISQFNALIGR